MLQRRRDLTFRLGRLAALYLEPADRETVQRLQARNTAWASGRMRVLSAGQASAIAALEAQYLEQRLTVAQELAERLARKGIPGFKSSHSHMNAQPNFARSNDFSRSKRLKSLLRLP